MIQRYFVLLNGQWKEVNSCMGQGWLATVKDESVIVSRLGYDGYALCDLAKGKHYVDCTLSEETSKDEFEQHLNNFLEFCTTLLED